MKSKTSLTRQGTGSYATSYAYNNLGQLSSETPDGRQTSYVYYTGNDAAAGWPESLTVSTRACSENGAPSSRP